MTLPFNLDYHHIYCSESCRRWEKVRSKHRTLRFDWFNKILSYILLFLQFHFIWTIWVFVVLILVFITPEFFFQSLQSLSLFQNIGIGLRNAIFTCRRFEKFEDFLVESDVVKRNFISLILWVEQGCPKVNAHAWRLLKVIINHETVNSVSFFAQFYLCKCVCYSCYCIYKPQCLRKSFALCNCIRKLYYVNVMNVKKRYWVEQSLSWRHGF